MKQKRWIMLLFMLLVIPLIASDDTPDLQLHMIVPQETVIPGESLDITLYGTIDGIRVLSVTVDLEAEFEDGTTISIPLAPDTAGNYVGTFNATTMGAYVLKATTIFADKEITKIKTIIVNKPAIGFELHTPQHIYRTEEGYLFEGILNLSSSPDNLTQLELKDFVHETTEALCEIDCIDCSYSCSKAIREKTGMHLLLATTIIEGFTYENKQLIFLDNERDYHFESSFRQRIDKDEFQQVTSTIFSLQNDSSYQLEPQHMKFFLLDSEYNVMTFKNLSSRYENNSFSLNFKLHDFGRYTLVLAYNDGTIMIYDTLDFQVITKNNVIIPEPLSIVYDATNGEIWSLISVTTHNTDNEEYRIPWNLPLIQFDPEHIHLIKDNHIEKLQYNDINKEIILPKSLLSKNQNRYIIEIKSHETTVLNHLSFNEETRYAETQQQHKRLFLEDVIVTTVEKPLPGLLRFTIPLNNSVYAAVSDDYLHYFQDNKAIIYTDKDVFAVFPQPPGKLIGSIRGDAIVFDSVFGQITTPVTASYLFKKGIVADEISIVENSSIPLRYLAKLDEKIIAEKESPLLAEDVIIPENSLFSLQVLSEEPTTIPSPLLHFYVDDLISLYNLQLIPSSPKNTYTLGKNITISFRFNSFHPVQTVQAMLFNDRALLHTFEPDYASGSVLFNISDILLPDTYYLKIVVVDIMHNRRFALLPITIEPNMPFIETDDGLKVSLRQGESIILDHQVTNKNFVNSDVLEFTVDYPDEVEAFLLEEQERNMPDHNLDANPDSGILSPGTTHPFKMKIRVLTNISKKVNITTTIYSKANQSINATIIDTVEILPSYAKPTNYFDISVEDITYDNDKTTLIITTANNDLLERRVKLSVDILDLNTGKVANTSLAFDIPRDTFKMTGFSNISLDSEGAYLITAKIFDPDGGKLADLDNENNIKHLLLSEYWDEQKHKRVAIGYENREDHNPYNLKTQLELEDTIDLSSMNFVYYRLKGKKQGFIAQAPFKITGITRSSDKLLVDVIVQLEDLLKNQQGLLYLFYDESWAVTNDDITAVLEQEGLWNPAVIIDNHNARLTGSWIEASSVPGFYGRDFVTDLHLGKGSKQAVYDLAEEMGNYEIYLWYPQNPSFAANTKINIDAADEITLLEINQRTSGGRWNYLGFYELDEQSTLTITNEKTDGIVVADAVKAVKVSGFGEVQSVDRVFNYSAMNISFKEEEHITNASLLEPSLIYNDTTLAFSKEMISEENDVQLSAVIGRPVKWMKKMKANNTNETKQTLNISTEIPTNASNIIVHEIIDENLFPVKEKIQELKKYRTEQREKKDDEKKKEKEGVIGIAAAETEDTVAEDVIVEEENKTIVFNDTLETNESKEYLVEYETAPPFAVERTIDQYKKEIIVGADLHYTNVLAYTALPIEVHPWQINLTWKEENTAMQITNYVDNDGNGLIDMIEWIIPHLSNQTFEVEIIVLNVQSYPMVGGNWTVYFNTTGTANLTITAIDNTTWSDSSEEGVDLKFLELKCGNQTIPYEWIDNGTHNLVFAENYSCDNVTSTETSKVLTPGEHHLMFVFDNQTAYANNFAGSWEKTFWNRRQPITITYNGQTTLTDFPAYINVSYSSAMQSDYDDLRFENGTCESTGGVDIPFEIENYTSESAHVWVKISEMIPGDNYICMYYDNDYVEGVDNKTLVWDNDYKGVWHLTEPNDINRNDSTKFGNNGTPSGYEGDEGVEGIIGGADYFDGGDYIDVADGEDLNLTSYTVTTWVKLDDITHSNLIVLWVADTAVPWGGYGLAVNRNGLGSSTGDVAVWVSQNTLGQYDYVEAKHNMDTNDKWYHIAAIWNNSLQNVTYYIDGQFLDVNNSAYGIVRNNIDVRIGSDGIRLMTGAIDEMRISNGSRSEDWINLSYQLMANQSTFVTFGDEEDSPAFNKSHGFDYNVIGEWGYVYDMPAYEGGWYEEWMWVDFQHTFTTTPVVIHTPNYASYNYDNLPSETRVTGINTTGFYIRVESWDDHDTNGTLPNGSIDGYWLAMEEGIHNVTYDGDITRVVEVGTQTFAAADCVDRDNGYYNANNNVNFQYGFTFTPMVFVDIQTANDDDVIMAKTPSQCTGSGEYNNACFNSGMTSLENSTYLCPVHTADETGGYIAWEMDSNPPGGQTRYTGLTGNASESNQWEAIWDTDATTGLSNDAYPASSFAASLSQAWTQGTAFATGVRIDGGDGFWAVPAYTNGSSAVYQLAAEDQQADSDLGHTTEPTAVLFFSNVSGFIFTNDSRTEYTYPNFYDEAVNVSLIGNNSAARFNVTINDSNQSISTAVGLIEGIEYDFSQGTGEEWYYDFTCSESNDNVSWDTVAANDTANFWNITSINNIFFECDAVAPIISNATINDTSPTWNNSWINVTANISDPENNLDTVILEVIQPDNIYMNITYFQDGIVFWNQTIIVNMTGQWGFRWYANDTAGNDATPVLSDDMNGTQNLVVYDPSELTPPTFGAFWTNQSIIGLNQEVRFSFDAYDEGSAVAFANGTIEGTVYDFNNIIGSEWFYDWECTAPSNTEVNMTFAYIRDTVGNTNQTNVSELSAECDASAPFFTNPAIDNSTPTMNMTIINVSSTVSDPESNLNVVRLQVIPPRESSYYAEYLSSGSVYYNDTLVLNDTGDWQFLWWANDTGNNVNSTYALETGAGDYIGVPYIEWSVSSLTIDSTTIGGGATTADASISSTNEESTLVGVSCVTGDCSAITDNWVDGSTISDGGSSTVTFSCSDSAAGSFSATFNTTSREDQDEVNITVSCDVFTTYGFLNVTLHTPTPNTETWTYRHELFWVNATVYCDGTSSALCGNVTGYVRTNFSDGPKDVIVNSDAFILNNYTYTTSTASAGDTVVNVADGDDFRDDTEILIIQMQNSSDGTAGTYEFVEIISANTSWITLRTPLENTYYTGAPDSNSATITQIVSVPSYHNVTIASGSLTAPEWNGYYGGIIAFRASVVNFTGGRINATAVGFRGGGCNGGGDGAWGDQGEGYTGTGTGTTSRNNIGGGGGYGPSGRGGEPGGGGGHATVGGIGDASGADDAEEGYTAGNATLSIMLFGGGGGGGGDNDNSYPLPDDGHGGGIVVIFADEIVNAKIYAQGQNARRAVDPNIYGGTHGAGAGGTIWLSARNMTIDDVNASGGINMTEGQQDTDDGGKGGDGYIRFDFFNITDGSTDPFPEYNSTPTAYPMLPFSVASGAIPFYTISPQPQSCVLQQGEYCLFNWSVNTTGVVLDNYAIDVLFLSNMTFVLNNYTDNATVIVAERIEPYFNNYSANMSTVGANESARFYVNVYDNDSNIIFVNGTINDSTYEFNYLGGDVWYYDYACNASVEGYLNFTYVGANDTFNNWNETDPAFSVTCDTTAPTVTVNAPSGTINDHTPTLNISFSETPNMVWYSYDAGGTNVTICDNNCNINETYHLVGNETSFSVTVYANDTVDNQGSGSTSYGINMQRQYNDTFDDNSSIMNYSGTIIWEAGNVSFSSSGAAVANITIFAINTTSNITAVTNISWDEYNTTADRNITVQVSADDGETWYWVEDEGNMSGFDQNSSLTYRVQFETNAATTIYLTRFDMAWTQFSIPLDLSVYNITLPENSSCTYDGHILVNYSLLGDSEQNASDITIRLKLNGTTIHTNLTGIVNQSTIQNFSYYLYIPNETVNNITIEIEHIDDLTPNNNSMTATIYKYMRDFEFMRNITPYDADTYNVTLNIWNNKSCQLQKRIESFVPASHTASDFSITPQSQSIGDEFAGTLYYWEINATGRNHTNVSYLIKGHGDYYLGRSFLAGLR